MFHQKREDGIVSLAVGLGHYVAGGRETLRFSPKYPELIPDFSNPSGIFNNSHALCNNFTSGKLIHSTESFEATSQHTGFSPLN